MNNGNINGNQPHLKINKRFYVLIILFTLFIVNYFYLNKKTVNISIIYTSDIKGNILSMDSENQIYGLVVLPYLLKKYKNFMLLDLGNSIYRTPESISNDGLDIARLMSDLKYDSVNIGSGELSWGTNKLARISQDLNFPFLSSNLTILNSHKPKIFFPYFVKEIKGVKIGVLGLIDKESLKLSCSEDLKDYEMKPIFQTLKKYVSFLREDEKVDVVVLLSRLDVDNDDSVSERNAYKITNRTIANEVPGIDLIISKPQCDEKLCKVYIASDKKSKSSKTIICSTIPSLEYIGKTNLVIRKKSKKIVSFSNELIPAKISYKVFARELEKDKNFLDFKDKRNKKFDDRIGRTEFEFAKKEGQKSNLGALITDIMKISANSDIALLENIFISDYIKVGAITNRHIFSVFPNNCEIMTFKMKGKDLLRLIEKSIYNGKEEYLNVSGLYYYFNRNWPVYSKVKEIMMEKADEKFNFDKVYKVAILDSMFNKKEDVYKNAFDVKMTNYKIQEMLSEYISTYIPTEQKYNNYDEKIKKIYKARDKRFIYKRNNRL